ncbi:lipocalin [Gordonibacter sp. 28C]|uniref:lipocalin n=1 Tax=Gordonibacter sp. 28C TaxID=2078569 RepID=UPI000DF76E3D|nr:lipocalin [Gordonibacter sp. 28C]RDB62388.1 lipocalin [Gordonibacter sp. 28C]
MEIARLVLGVALLIATAALAVQLWNGRWQSLIARPQRTKKGTFFPEGTRRAGQRVAWVMVACFAVVATLMASEMSGMVGSALFAQAAFVLNTLALAAYCGCVLWTVLAHCKAHGRPYFGDGFVHLAVTLLASCAVLTVLSLLFA